MSMVNKDYHYRVKRTVSTSAKLHAFVLFTLAGLVKTYFYYV